MASTNNRMAAKRGPSSANAGPRESSVVRVLGIDPGSLKSGWGLVDYCTTTRRVSHVDNGVFMLDGKSALPLRLKALSLGLHALVQQVRPDVAAVEDIFVRHGPRAALTLGQARGAAVATLALSGLEVHSHAATEVKKYVTGRGRATKDQVSDMVCSLLGLRDAPFEDAADALGVALCHALVLQSPLAGLGAASARSSSSSSSRSSKSRRAGFAALAKAQGKAGVDS